MGFLHSQLFVTPRLPPGTDFSGQTIIVTGANSGLGLEAARHFASLGVSKLIIAVRNLQAGEDARQDILRTSHCAPSAIEVWELDLTSFDSVEAFAERASGLPRLDVLLENAGVSSMVYDIAEKFERTLTVNVISTFLLALLLLPKLKAQVKEHEITPRIVIVSSETHAWVKYTQQQESDIFAALSDKSLAKMNERYMLSKLLEILVVRQLAPRLASSGVVMNAINPGFCKSGLSRDGGFFAYFMSFMLLLLGRTTEMGSRALVAGAAAGSESHGCYMTDSQVDNSALSSYVRSAESDADGKELWRQLQTILEGISPGVTKSI